MISTQNDSIKLCDNDHSCISLLAEYKTLRKNSLLKLFIFSACLITCLYTLYIFAEKQIALLEKMRPITSDSTFYTNLSYDFSKYNKYEFFTVELQSYISALDTRLDILNKFINTFDANGIEQLENKWSNITSLNRQQTNQYYEQANGQTSIYSISLRNTDNKSSLFLYINRLYISTNDRFSITGEYSWTLTLDSMLSNQPVEMSKVLSRLDKTKQKELILFISSKLAELKIEADKNLSSVEGKYTEIKRATEESLAKTANSKQLYYFNIFSRGITTFVLFIINFVFIKLIYSEVKFLNTSISNHMNYIYFESTQKSSSDLLSFLTTAKGNFGTHDTNTNDILELFKKYTTLTEK